MYKLKHNPHWYKYAQTEEDKEKVDQQLLNAKPAFKLLERLLEENLVTLQKDSYSKKHFLLPKWELYQAFSKGEEKQINKVLDFLKKL